METATIKKKIHIRRGSPSNENIIANPSFGDDILCEILSIVPATMKNNSRRDSRANENIIANASFGDDILCEILSRVLVKSLMQFKFVCKHWRSVIKDPSFVDLHFSRPKSRPDGTTLLISALHAKIVGRVLFTANLSEGGAAVPRKLALCRQHTLDGTSMLKPVNGLLCFTNSIEGSVLIYNPSTGEKTSWIRTTISVGKQGKGISRGWKFGFGYDPNTKEHKVLSLFSRVCEVLTVGDNTWRKIDEVLPDNPLGWGESVYVNGVIYWGQNYPRSDVLMAFDVGSEKFRVIPIPNFIVDRWQFRFSHCYELVEVDGRITLIDRLEHGRIKLWIFDDDDDHGDMENKTSTSSGSKSWVEENIELPWPRNGKSYISVVAIAGTDQIILQIHDSRELEFLYFYDRKTEDFRKVELTETPGFGYQITTFVESILPVCKQQHTLPPPRK